MTVALTEVVALLEGFAPLHLAADWDNVGLLIEPCPLAEASVSKIALTIDLREPVLEEALANGAELIVAYHPPIFTGLKRLTHDSAAGRIAILALSEGVFVYSPHTALDACRGGLNDWLASAFGPGSSLPIEPASTSPDEGQGRVIDLERPIAIDEAITRVKAHLNLDQVRVAEPQAGVGMSIQRVAVCAGAGGSVFSDVQADLYLTGEMRHHDILAKQACGAAVIVCDHTNTERGYLPVLAARLRQAFGERVSVAISARDIDPLSIV